MPLLSPAGSWDLRRSACSARPQPPQTSRAREARAPAPPGVHHCVRRRCAQSESTAVEGVGLRRQLALLNSPFRWPGSSSTATSASFSACESRASRTRCVAHGVLASRPDECRNQLRAGSWSSAGHLSRPSPTRAPALAFSCSPSLRNAAARFAWRAADARIVIA